jgi:hypothetical protein
LRQYPCKKVPHLPAKNSTKNFNKDINSPEGTGIINTIKRRPVGSPESFINKFYNSPNISIITKILFPDIRF